MRVLIALSALLALGACSVEPGSEAWCEQMKEKPMTELTLDDGKVFAQHCVLDSTTIGSEAWCGELEKKDKGDWSASEAADYAKHCVM